MIFDRQNEPSNEQEIQRFEEKKGIRLPADYREFLLEFNGGRPAADNATWKTTGSNFLDVDELYGLTDSSLNSIETERFNNFSDFVHSRLLQIGHSYGSGLYVDLREGRTHGKIYILARPANEALQVDDTGFQDEDDYEEALFLHPVANNFSEFVAMLGPDPNEA